MDTLNQVLITQRPDYNLHSININSKSNGSIISIIASQKFDNNSISASINRSGWMNITIPGGIIDSSAIVNTQKLSPIEHIRCLQYNESAQISFLMSDDVDEFDITTPSKHA